MRETDQHTTVAMFPGNLDCWGGAPATKLTWVKKRAVDPVTFKSDINQMNSVITFTFYLSI